MSCTLPQFVLGQLFVPLTIFPPILVGRFDLFFERLIGSFVSVPIGCLLLPFAIFEYIFNNKYQEIDDCDSTIYKPNCAKCDKILDEDDFNHEGIFESQELCNCGNVETIIGRYNCSNCKYSEYSKLTLQKCTKCQNLFNKRKILLAKQQQTLFLFSDTSFILNDISCSNGHWCQVTPSAESFIKFLLYNNFPKKDEATCLDCNEIIRDAETINGYQHCCCNITP